MSRATTTNTTDTGVEETDTCPAAGAAVGELLLVDPATLVLGPNTRVDVKLDPHFAASIRDRGVREPITVRRREDGALVVRKGQRRTLAAVKVGLERVRVLVEPEGEPDDGAPAQIERIIDQLGENHHRAGITDADEVRAHQQLLDLGLTAAQIARRSHTPAARVRATTAVARSQLATAVMGRYDVTLDQAAVIAEFDDGTLDGTEAVKLLTVTAQREPHQFAHLAQRIRDDREDAALVQARTGELAATGVAVIDPETVEEAVALARLRPTTEDPAGTELTPDAHTGCAGHAAHVHVRRPYWAQTPEVVTTYYCTDPAGNGHTDRYDPPAGGGRVGAGQGGERAEEEKAAQRAERKRVIENNKAWDSAVTVRRNWLRGFLARKTSPKDAGRYIAAVLGQGSHDVRKAMESGNRLGCELLGLGIPAGYNSGQVNPIAEAAGKAGSARATMLSLAVLLCAFEEGTTRNSWRSPTAETRAYVQTLKDWGYPLAPVEQLVLDPEAQNRTGDTPADADRAAAHNAEGHSEEVEGETDRDETSEDEDEAEVEGDAAA